MALQFNFWRSCLNKHVLNIAIRQVSGKSGVSLYKFATTDDESTIVAWHPKKDFPYECTKPLPVEAKADSTSVLKTQLTPELREIFNKKPQDEVIRELMNITHTTKHRWYPRARDKKAKKTPMDREYL